MGRTGPLIAVGFAMFGCREPDVLDVHLLISNPLVPRSDFETVHLRVSEVDSDRVVLEGTTSGSELGSGADVIDIDALDSGRSYLLTVIADAPEACIERERAVGQARFTHRTGSYDVTVRVGCADEFAALEPGLARLGGRVVATTDGSAWVVGGTRVLHAPDAASIAGTEPVPEIERYRAQTGRFVESGRLLEPRTNPATAALGDSVFVAGGLKETSLLCSSGVEIVSESGVQGGESLEQARCFPGAATLVSGSGIVVAGGALNTLPDEATDAELFDASGRKHIAPGITGAVHRSDASVVALSSPGRALVVGLPYTSAPLTEIFSSDCGAGPCFEPSSGQGPPGDAYYVAVTYAPCESGGGAVYLTGGIQPTPTDPQSFEALTGIWCMRDSSTDSADLVFAGDLPEPRFGHMGVAVRGARLLLIGGQRDDEELPYANGLLLDVDACSCEVGSASRLVGLPPGAYVLQHSADRLDDGSVLVVGGASGESLLGVDVTAQPYAALFVPDLD